jgi:hypothetical protein
VKHIHLTQPRLEFWVTVEVRERDGRYMATADLGEDSRDVGVADTPQEAVREALRTLGEPYATEWRRTLGRRRNGTVAMPAPIRVGHVSRTRIIES